MNLKFEHYQNASDIEEIAEWLNKLVGDTTNVESVKAFQIIESGRSYEERHDPEHRRYDCVALVSYWDAEEKQANLEVAAYEAQEKRNQSQPD